jgi:hypothetical protein
MSYLPRRKLSLSLPKKQRRHVAQTLSQHFLSKGRNREPEGVPNRQDVVTTVMGGVTTA